MSRPSSGVRGRMLGHATEALIIPILILVLWQLLAELNVLEPVLFSRPSEVAATAADAAASGQLVTNVVVTLKEVLGALALSVLIGIPLGIAMGSSRILGFAIEPLFSGLYSTPIFALFPLFVLWLGTGYVTILMMATLFGLSPVILSTAAGVRSIDQLPVTALKSLGGRAREIAVKVALPAAVPSILIGVQLSIGRVLVGVIVSELLVGSSGIGYSIAYSAAVLDTAGVFFGILATAVVAAFLDRLLALLQRRMQRWQT